MAEAVYVLCALTSVACAALLLRNRARSGSRLALWTSVCFAALALNNTFLFVDLVVVPTLDMSVVRNAISLAGVSSLLYAMITEGT